MSELVLTDAPTVALPALTKLEAEGIAAMDGVMRRYKLGEWIRCRTCFAANRMDGCRSLVAERIVRLECRCGLREYHAPQGTTDLLQNRANSALTGANQGQITVVDGSGNSVTLKAVKLEAEDAAIIRLYSRITGALNLNPKLFHRDCWDRRPFDSSAMEILVDPSKIALKCGCCVFHYAGSTDN